MIYSIEEFIQYDGILFSHRKRHQDTQAHTFTFKSKLSSV